MTSAPRAPDEPTRGRIASEIVLYTLLVLVVGAVFVGWRVWREGPRVLSHAPHSVPKHAAPVAPSGR